MAFLALYSRKLMLTDQVNKYQNRLTDMTEKKMAMSDDISKMMTEKAKIKNSDSPAIRNYEAKVEKLRMLENQLDLEMQKMQTKLQAAQTELQSLDQGLQQGIQSSFSVKYAGG